VPDPAGPNNSQGYISEVATRATIFIENPLLGLVCFLPIGMAEVSSCDITVATGDHVEKGDPIGMFHFGGSSHCLIFGPQVELDFDLHGQAPNLNAYNIAVRDRIAIARG
jgi:phosphatidylserine decarboxylase